MATSREFKVGAFALAGMAVVGLVVFMIGEERKLFESKLNYNAHFQEVQGLRRGSPVRMGGVDIGTVVEVAYGEVADDKRILVRMNIVKDESRRIRQDSVASIENKPGKQGSLAVYNYLQQTFGTLDAKAAAHGPVVFAEHTADARNRPGAHPNVDILLAIAAGGEALRIGVVAAG